MRFPSVFQLFGSGWRNRRARRQAGRSALERLVVRLAVEELEDRVMLSVAPTLPAPVVSNQQTIANGFSPMVVVDPTNPQNVVAVFSTTALVEGYSSTDAGRNWTPFLNDPRFLPDTPNLFAPNQVGQVRYAQATNATAAWDRNENFYVTYTEHDATNNSGALVLQKYAFNSGNPSHTIADNVLSQWVGQDPVLNPVVAVDANVPTASDTGPFGTTMTQTDTMANPITNTGNGTTPKAIYVAWNTSNTAPTGAVNFNPNTIKVVASEDGGQKFTTQQYVNDGSSDPNFGGERDSTPQMVFTQGVAGNANTGGQLTFLWNNFANNTLVTDSSQPDGGSATASAAATASFNGPGGTINEATDNGLDSNNNDKPDTPVTTTFSQTLNFSGADPNFQQVSDLDVTLSLVHPHLNEISVVLSATDALGNSLGSVTLFAVGSMADKANMGVINGNDVGTVFDQQAPRVISDANASNPYIAHFRPIQGGLNSGGLTAFNGLKLPQLTGSTWTLSVTDTNNENENNTTFINQKVDAWSLHFSDKISTTQFGADSTISSVPTRPGTPEAPVAGAATSPFPQTGASGQFPRGIGPSAVLAVDNTLGAYSPYQGRLYVAYVGQGASTRSDDTDVFLVSSDDGGISWSAPVRVNNDSVTDGFSEGTRPQFMPSLAVDQTTGTVVVTFYDARNDAARARVATYIADSIDGGADFSPEVYLNTPKTAIDTITDPNGLNPVVLEPLPDNPATAGGSYGFGDRQGLAVSAGHVYALWSGNLNGSGSEILTATTTIAAGPRVLSGDMGPVVNDFTYTDPQTDVVTTYNNTFASDGTRQLGSFVVTFDRPISASSFTTTDVKVNFLSANASSPTSFTAMTVQSVTPLDGSDTFGPNNVGGNNTLATSFLISIIDPATGKAPSGVGTYSYYIQPVTITDRIRQKVTAGVASGGNGMDQNQNTITDELPGDDFAIPRPLTGTPGVLPYDQNTLPLIIPGPHVVQTFVNGSPATPDNLVLNATVSSLDVVFDRDMNPTSLTGADVLRMIGPLGPVGDTFTVTADPDPGYARLINGVTTTAADPDSNHPRTYRITFEKSTGGANPQLVPDPQALSGTYTLSVSPTATSFVGNDAVDTNLNAGLDLLRGNTAPGGATSPVTYNSTDVPKTIATGFNVPTTSVLTIPDSFVVQGVSVQLNITYPTDGDLEITLEAPDLTSVRLAPNVGGSGANFTNTIFSDTGTTPIQQGSAPFSQGPYNPQTPLGAFIGKSSAGKWQLVIKDNNGNPGTKPHTLNSWSLTFLRPMTGSGLGEAVADQFSPHFRIFTQDPTNPLSQTAWTAVGPASIESGSRSGRVTGLAVDPSDPSGNTVYVGGASGGIWKTTNFLTNDPNGPTYVPLTSFGPTFAMNIGAIAVFTRNGDPNQSIIFAATGEGDTGSQGVGFLRSLNGGATWTLLDSTTNVDSNGNELAISSALRDHAFVGTNGFKIAIDPKATSTGGVIVYAALSSGVWVSYDTGNTWGIETAPGGGKTPDTRVANLAGDATDVVLAAGSAENVGSGGNIQIVYAALDGKGVYFSQNQGQTFTQTADGSATFPYQGNPLIRDGDNNGAAIPVTDPSSSPNGAKGRIVLVTPFATGNPFEDFFYQGWLYAAVVTTGGHLDGLYLTKDFGGNWTKVGLPELRVGTTNAYPSNDESLATTADPLGSTVFAQGNYDVSLAIDPTNPNVVYLGGTDDGQPQPQGGLIRVDTTGISDPHAFVPYDNNNPDGGKVQTATTGPLALKKPAVLPGILEPDGSTNTNAYLNLTRDPQNPFLADSTVLVTNVSAWNNDGTDASWMPFNDVLAGSTDQHRVVSFVDPLTGHARLIFGDDQGVFTGVDLGNGTLDMGIGTAKAPTFSRNGNLQITQFYYGATQPSLLAADVAGALFYGMAQDDGFPQSTSDILRTGNLNWTGPGGDGTGVATDQTGSGTLYQFKWPCCGGNNTEFFQVTPAGGTPIGRLGQSGASLLQPGDDPANNKGEWPYVAGSNFAVNPINGQAIVISSQTGQIFRTVDQGLHWFVIGAPADLDKTYAPALAFGAPETSTANLNNFIYAGTSGGKIFVTFSGGGFNGSTKWKDISAGLDGSSVEAIYTNPTRGSHEAYAVTLQGVYYLADSSVLAPTWVNITGNLFKITHTPFGDTNLTETQLKYLTSIAVDYRAVPGKPVTTPPVLYVGGEGGVFRSLDQGKTWTLFPSLSDGAVANGGLLPDAHVTDLDLEMGNIDPNTGKPSQSAGPNVLVATTYGRGVYAIRLTPNLVPGPRVLSVVATDPNTTDVHSVTVTFNGPVEPSSFTTADIGLLAAPDGTAIKPLSVTDITPDSSTGNLHNIYRIDFPDQTQNGAYTIVLGPKVSDFAGNLMDQNQNGIDGEPSKLPILNGDTFTGYFYKTTGSNGVTDPTGAQGPFVPAIIGTNSNGQTFVLVSNGMKFTNQEWSTTFSGPNWQDTVTGDFNGDGKADIASFYAPTGQVVVGISNGSGFTTSVWGQRSLGQWSDTVVGDFNGDGKDDIAMRYSNGNVFVALSTGSSFVITYWDTWIRPDQAAGAVWQDVRVGDFRGIYNTDANGVKHPIDDIEGGIILTGPVVISGAVTGASNTGPITITTAGNATAGLVNGDTVTVSDVGGNTAANGTFTVTHVTLDSFDLVGSQGNGAYTGGGTWQSAPKTETFRDIFIAESNGSSFQQKYWQSWSQAPTWVDVTVGDYTGDGKAGLTARVLQNGTVWVSYDYTHQTARSFGGQQLWQQWDSNVTWLDVRAGNFDTGTAGDRGPVEGKTDLVARDAGNNGLYVSLDFVPHPPPAAQGDISMQTMQQGWGALPGASNFWANAVVGDFTGDGKDDLAIRYLPTGVWYMNVANSAGKAFSPYEDWLAVWDPSVNWINQPLGKHL